MKRSILGFAAAASILIGSIAVIAAETPATQPAKHTRSKLTEPYNKLSNLTDSQNAKLEAIHTKYEADLKELRDKADTDSREILTDAQKSELDKILDERKDETAEKNKTRRMAKSATTAPAT